MKKESFLWVYDLAFEMKIVAHLMTRGFDVVFHDMEEGVGFDYLATSDGVEIEVECKFISGDIGRQIHLKKMHQLGTVLLPEMVADLDKGCGGLVIRILIPGKLGANEKQYDKICRLMSQAIVGQKSGAKLDDYQISISKFSVADSPFAHLPPGNISLDHAKRFLSDEFGVENKNFLIRFNPQGRAILVVVESAKEDAVLKGIHRQLKDSARKQLSGNRPGILCCELADVTEEQLLEFRNDKKTGLQLMASDLIARRPQIHTVAFITPGTVRLQNSTTGTTRSASAQETGPAYAFSNSNHQMANDPRYNVFFDT